MDQYATFEGDVWLWHDGQQWLWKPQSEPRPDDARAANRYSHEGETFIALSNWQGGQFIRDAVKA